jgi:alkylhydroperoxidase/carboxymuconolactone decarboxylase family protein YurZ
MTADEPLPAARIRAKEFLRMKPDDERQAWVELPPRTVMAVRRLPGSPYDFGFITGMGRLLMAHPRIGEAFMSLFGEIMFAPGHLSRQEREMIASVATAAQFCHY